MSACQILFEHTNRFVFLDLHRRREARCRFSLQDGSKIKYEEAERDRNDRLRLGVATSPIMLCPYRRSRHDGPCILLARATRLGRCSEMARFPRPKEKQCHTPMVRLLKWVITSKT